MSAAVEESGEGFSLEAVCQPILAERSSARQRARSRGGESVEDGLGPAEVNRQKSGLARQAFRWVIVSDSLHNRASIGAILEESNEKQAEDMVEHRDVRRDRRWRCRGGRRMRRNEPQLNERNGRRARRF